ncbi:MAG: hypothetical protein B6D44_13215 [Ignavibacteriales bacterium UTCHB2]|jgi:glycosyltransferase involved in cell wall biosynthesis|nr:MAG: hypothetical protein B6D44_13215 [Ignavibacteriales bacterium UTCHB2]
MNNIDVSIIIPCYNHGNHIREAIESVKACKYDNSEIIIVNDGSTEPSTLKIFSELERDGYFILHQENQGLGAARNNGIKISKGRYFLPLDSDNKIKPEYLIKGVPLLDNNKDLAVVYGKPFFFGTIERPWAVQEFCLEKLIISNYIDACAIIRKKAWEECGGYYEKKELMGYEDWDLWMRIAIKGWEFKFIDEFLYEYQVREGSMIENRENNSEVIKYIFNQKELSLAKSYRDLYFKHVHLVSKVRFLSKFLPARLKLKIKAYLEMIN